MFQKSRVSENFGTVVLLHDAAVPNLLVGGGAPLLEGNLGLLVPAIDDELVMVHKPLEGVWQE